MVERKPLDGIGGEKANERGEILGSVSKNLDSLSASDIGSMVAIQADLKGGIPIGVVAVGVRA